MSLSAETERLLLRPVAEEDLTFFQPIWADPEVMRYVGAGQTRDEAGARELIGHLVEHWRRHGFGFWAVVPREEGVPVGWAGLGVPAFLPAVLPAVEVAWLLARSHWGRGYATEAGRAALRFGFGELELDRIIALVAPANSPSIRVVERLEMTPCGVEQHPRTGMALRMFERHA